MGKEALRIRIRNEMTRAQLIISRFLRRRQEKIKYRFFRNINLFYATIYLESPLLDGRSLDHGSSALNLSSSITCENLNSESVVHIFGEFSPEMPWQVFIPCKYDPHLKCFKVDIMIRTGQ